MSAPGEKKIKLTAYEFMCMMGAAGDPHLSETLNASLRGEQAKPAYKGLGSQQAFGKAARYLSLNHPEVFDPANQDDAMMKKLAPLMFRENGKPVPPPDLFKHIEFDNIAAMAVDKGARVDVTLSARDPGSPPMTAQFSLKTKDPKRKPGT